MIYRNLYEYTYTSPDVWSNQGSERKPELIMRIYNTICGPFATCTHSVRVVCDERLNRLYAVLRTHKQELDKWCKSR